MRIPRPDPSSVRDLTRRLVALPSVSPDVQAETRCAETLLAHLPAECDAGVWSAADGRPVVWAILAGDSPRTTLLLGHYDTVGVEDYAGLAAGADAAIAFDGARVREALLGRRAQGVAMSGVLARDLDDEAATPGTWEFGRGALDMKSGLAAAAFALESLVRAPRAGHVLFVATPDEEHASAGMAAAVEGILRLARKRALDLLGALNLDYAGEPCAFHGVLGKMAVGCWVRGEPGHAAGRTRTVDAARLAAAIALGASERPLPIPGDQDLAPAPAVIALRDRKPRYDAQTTAEALVELSVVSASGEPAAVVDALRDLVRDAGARLGGERGDGALPLEVRAWSDLAARPDSRTSSAQDLDRARASTLTRVRAAAESLARPSVLLFLLPPYYPPSPARPSAVATAARSVLATKGLPVFGAYPNISDASYLGWHGAGEAEIARFMPAMAAEYRWPIAASAALDLDVVNLGPWGRDAHGPHERAHAGWAFAELPGLIADVVSASWTVSPCA